MMAEKEKQRRALFTDFFKRCCNWLFFLKRSAAPDFIAKEGINLNSISLVGTFFFRKRRLDPALHRKRQKKLKNTWSSHVIFD